MESLAGGTEVSPGHWPRWCLGSPHSVPRSHLADICWTDRYSVCLELGNLRLLQHSLPLSLSRKAGEGQSQVQDRTLGLRGEMEKMVWERLRDGDGGNRGGRVTSLLYLTVQLWCVFDLLVGKLGVT